MMKLLLCVYVLLSIFTVCCGFQNIHNSFGVCKYALYSTPKKLSYSDALKQAQINRSNPQQQLQQEQQVQQQQVQQKKQVSIDVESSSNGLPFSDEIYDDIKYVAEKLSGRMKSGKALSSAEVVRFKIAAEAIIKDSSKYSRKNNNINNRINYQNKQNDDSDSDDAFQIPVWDDGDDNDDADNRSISNTSSVVDIKQSSSSSSSSAPSHYLYDRKAEDKDKYVGDKGDLTDPNHPFNEIAGNQSTWNVPGSDNMTTEEYYKAINNRIKVMKEKRKELGLFDRDSAKNYLDSLGK